MCDVVELEHNYFNLMQVEYDEAQAYAEENGLLFMETSAKTAMNVNDIFLAIGNYFLVFKIILLSRLINIFVHIVYKFMCMNEFFS